MADERRPRDEDDRSAGFDVWLPAAAAVAAALFMLASAHAETAPPRAIYDAARFDEAAIAREAAEADAARAMSEADRAERRHIAVRVVALPVIEATAVAAEAAIPAPAAMPQAPVEAAIPARPGWLRVLAPLGIAMLLAAALVGIGRVWHRTEPSLA